MTQNFDEFLVCITNGFFELKVFISWATEHLYYDTTHTFKLKCPETVTLTPNMYSNSIPNCV